ncbi:MAG: hypothetical protein H0W89_05440 [Candidatus Levybacteria bacterium]|nr:hypothetical protein [Candidatus Levybacteria bacterium]
MSERESSGSRKYDRRGFGRILRTGAEYAAASYALTYVGFEAVDAMPYRSEITFSPRQHVRLLQESMKDGERQATFVLGGLTVQDASPITEPLTPVLEKLAVGPIGNGIYAPNDPNPRSIALQMDELQRQYGINTFSVYGHSIGPHILGQVIQEGERMDLRPWRLKNVWGDCTPPKSGYGYNPGVERFL